MSRSGLSKDPTLGEIYRKIDIGEKGQVVHELILQWDGKGWKEITPAEAEAAEQ